MSVRSASRAWRATSALASFGTELAAMINGPIVQLHHECRDRVVAARQPINPVMHLGREQHPRLAIDRPLVPTQVLQLCRMLIEDCGAQSVQRKPALGLQITVAARLGHPTEQYSRGPIVLAVVTRVNRCARPEQHIEHAANSHGIGRKHVRVAGHRE